MNNTRNSIQQQKLKLSPFSVNSELVFNAEYFLKSESSSFSPSTSVESEEMEVENQYQQPIQQFPEPKFLRQTNVIPPPVMRTRIETPIPIPHRVNHADFIQKAATNHMAMLSNVNSPNNFKTPYMSAPKRAGLEGTVNQRDVISAAAARDNNLLAEEYEKLVDSFNQAHEREKETKQFKLPSSKSPIMEALVYCSINKYGIELKELNTTSNRILFYVSDFNVYYKQSCMICSKQSPSEDIRARMKALQRWFVTFPAWRELEYPFELLVKPSHYSKMHDIISKMVRFYENSDLNR
jgi:hypothetical protein